MSKNTIFVETSKCERPGFEEYDYEAVYKPGAENSNTNALPRIGTFNKKVDDLEEIVEAVKGKILHDNNDSNLRGHRGMNKTYEAIKQHYYWPNVKEEVEKYMWRCTKCQLNKVLIVKRKTPMEIATTADHPFEKFSLDTVGPLVESEWQYKRKYRNINLPE
jgi:hypothetical protein